jgi:hypothetical protein
VKSKQAVVAVVALALLVGASTLATGSQVEAEQEYEVASVPGSIEPLCTDSNEPISTIAQLRQSKIEIEIPKSRKWSSNIVAAKTSSGTTIPDEFKKKFKARFYVTPPNGSPCIFKGSIRISGDWRDHLSIKNGTPIASIDVQLDEGNLAGVVDFKLLLPKTRGGDNEIVQAALMREMDLLSPRTAQLNVTVNGVSVEYMFQENLEKELLESQNRREAPLFESDESMFWDDRRDKQLPEGNDQRIIVPKMTNSSWMGESQNRIGIAKRGLDVLYSAYASYWETRNLAPVLIANDNPDYLQKNYEFLALMNASNAQHGLITHNRRFFFDPMKNALEPVYYDGDSKILDPSREVIPVGYGPKQGALGAVKRLNNLDRAEFAKLLNSYGVSISDADLNLVLDDLLKRLADYALTEVAAPSELAWKANNFADLNSTDRALVFAKDQNEAMQCDFELKICAEIILSMDDYQDLISGKLEKDGTRIVYGGGSLENYKGGLEPYQDEMSAATTYYLASGETFIVSGEATVSIDEVKDSIDVTALSAGSRLYLANADLSGWTISYTGSPGLVAPKTEDRFDDRLLTGCVNIVDSKVVDVSFKVDSALCEDGLNLIRVTGNIPRLEISNTLEDGLDLDFSQVAIAELIVSDTGNDCLDLSAGKYVANTVTLTNCGDKGVSIGETAVVNFKEVIINGAVLGLAVKDWSDFTAETVSITQAQTCTSAYRKKQEFGRAVINIGQLDCAGTPLDIQDYSTLSVGK